MRYGFVERGAADRHGLLEAAELLRRPAAGTVLRLSTAREFCGAGALPHGLLAPGLGSGGAGAADPDPARFDPVFTHGVVHLAPILPEDMGDFQAENVLLGIPGSPSGPTAPAGKHRRVCLAWASSSCQEPRPPLAYQPAGEAAGRTRDGRQSGNSALQDEIVLHRAAQPERLGSHLPEP